MSLAKREQGGRLVRSAWIEGVKRFFPGEPKASSIALWGEMSEWEKDIVSTLYEQVSAFLLAGLLEDQPIVPLTHEQGGRLVRLIWIGQVYRLLPQPKETYIQVWETMPEWERETDMSIYLAIEQEVMYGRRSSTTEARD